MENEKILVRGLIEKLENVEIKLKEAKEEAGIEFTQPHNKCRSFTRMKNILDTLVNKIVDGKNDGDEISLISELPLYYEQSVFQNLISSEEYIEETKKALSTITKPGLILNLLLNFLELLGDILYSVCEINNHNMKVPSGVTVKDLITIKVKYVSLWNLILTNTRHNSSKVINHSLFEAQSEMKLNELKKPLQLCLKEMSKVKLQIEHYFKCNIIEMQLTTSFNDFNYMEKIKLNENETKRNEKETFLFLGNECNNTKNMTFNTPLNFSMDNAYNSHSTLFSKTSPEPTDSSAEGQNGYILNSKTTLGPHVKKESGEDLFSSSFVYSHEYLLSGPLTIFTVPQIKPTQNNSLPKIYSVDSVTENVGTSMPSPYRGKLTNIANDVKGANNKTEINGKITSETTLSATSSTEEDLFKDDVKMELSDSQSVELRTKISSLLDMLKENENIFDQDSLGIEDSDLSSFNSRKSSQQNQKILLSVLKNKDHVRSDELNRNVIFVEQSEKYQHKPLHQKTNKITKNNKCVFTPVHHSRVDINNHNPIPTEQNIIHDQTSLIELFRTTKENYSSNSESYSHNGSSYVWPVTAEYIYTSKQQGPSYLDHSISSNNSSPLATNFGKSFFSLHLNKRYEQNLKYDGDLIVLENHEGLNNYSNSSNSLVDQSNVIIDIDRQKVKEGGYCIGQQYQNCTEHSSSTQPLDPHKGAISKVKTPIDAKKALAIHYTNYTTPYLPINNTFTRENFDFLKINGYDNNNNWNSFISIFTSKVGPAARINHHSMFRKIINNIGNEALSTDNMVGNVHTLTSNGGPFRLFDLNGYPLTDCAGNVLKDPYGKAVVELDSTGFPKYDIKVYDAAGNSLNDVNFDPTQKPKTNTIIIKLTDNFKRPLHLFDKYGRPLTDFNGKLLVNIHGRPLLRFDNFGRPNTDYRGGPLYTDNGFRWSYKNIESFSNEKLTNEQLISRKLTDNFRSVQINESCEPMNTVSSQFSGVNGDFENGEEKLLQKDKLSPNKSTRSDIWVTVESVLQGLPKKKKIADLKSSQTSVIINNVTVTHGSVEKGFLEPIIYHDNTIGLQKHLNHKNNTNFIFSKDKNNVFSVNRLNNCLLKDNTHLFLDKTDYVTNENLTTKMPAIKNQFPFYNNILLHNTCSKCFKLTQKNSCNPQKFDYMMTSNVSGENKTNLENTILLESSNCFPKKEFMTASNVSKENLFKRVSIKLNTNNHNYLDKLCNQILKNQIDGKARSKQYITDVKFKDGKWTETSHSNMMSSSLSKSTSEPQNISESREITIETAQKRAEANYCYGCYKETQLKTYLQKSNQSFFGKVQNIPVYFRNRAFAIKRSELDTSISKKYQKKNLSQSSEEDTLSNVRNKENKSYQINVKDKTTQELEPKRYSSSLHDNLHLRNSIEKLKPKVATAKERHSKLRNTQRINLSQSRKLKNHNRETRDSPFRFPSEHKLNNSYPEDEIKYVHSGNHDLSSSKDSKIDPTCIKQDFKRQYLNDIKRYEDENMNIYERTPLKKRKKKQISPLKTLASTKTECNIVSFLGSPVKYVLTKLDSKRFPKHQPNCIRKSGIPNKLYRKDNKESSTNSTYGENPIEKTPLLSQNGETTNKISEEIKIKTLYFCESGKNKNSTTTVDKLITNNKLKNRSLLKQKSDLIAFQSKSCVNILSTKNYPSMSYSGNEKYTTASENNLNGISLGLRKCSSVKNFIKADRLKKNNHLRNVHKQENSEYKTENVGMQTCKPSTARKKNKFSNNGMDKSSKNNKGTLRKHKKSPALTKNKKKEFFFF